MSLEERLEYAEMKNRHKIKLTPWYKKWWGILIIILLILLLSLIISSTFYVINKVKEIQQGNNTEQQQQQIELIKAAIKGHNSYYIGNENAEITIIEFSDFACPFCQKAYPELKEIVQEYKGKVKLVFRDYPLHDQSIDMALAARCAGEQNNFWPMHDKLFANQDLLVKLNNTELIAKLEALASTLNINSNQFNKCLESQKYKSDIRQDYQDGNLLQVQGTPTWFINNYKLTGYLPKEQFEKIISGLLIK